MPKYESVSFFKVKSAQHSIVYSEIDHLWTTFPSSTQTRETRGARLTLDALVALIAVAGVVRQLSHLRPHALKLSCDPCLLGLPKRKLSLVEALAMRGAYLE